MNYVTLNGLKTYDDLIKQEIDKSASSSISQSKEYTDTKLSSLVGGQVNH